MTQAPSRVDYITPGHPTAFTGITRISQHYDQKPEKARKFLENIHSYSLHREYKKPKHRNPYYVYFLRQQWQIDLIDLQKYSKDNNGFKFVLVCVDLFSRKCFARLLKNKSAKVVVDALKSIFNDLDSLPKSIFSDHGSELKNKLMNKYLKGKGIKIIHAKSEIKAGIVERLNKSIQNLIFMYMTELETNTYYDKFDDIIQSYNSRPHRSLNELSPNDAELEENKLRVLDAHNFRYTKILNKTPKIELKVGDWVRINMIRHIFARGYHEKWSRDMYEIVQVSHRMPITMYKLKCLTSEEEDEEIEGLFYKNELSHVRDDENVFKIEKVLKEKKNQCLVKWLDWPDRYNSWIDCDTARNIQQ